MPARLVWLSCLLKHGISGMNPDRTASASLSAGRQSPTRSGTPQTRTIVLSRDYEQDGTLRASESTTMGMGMSMGKSWAIRNRSFIIIKERDSNR